MTNFQISEIVSGLPHMTLFQANQITEFIHQQQITSILELGFRHGVSTCYMANALRDDANARIITIDLERARSEVPNIETLLERVGLRERVTIYYEPSSYTWRMMKMLEEDPRPRFDLCYIDGAHTWFVDGFAFFLADRLLNPGGWLIFDDLEWSCGSIDTVEVGRVVPKEEQNICQIERVYELLVKPHPAYHNFRIEEGWAYAQKRTDLTQPIPSIKQEVLVKREQVGLGIILLKLYHRLSRAFGL